MNFPYFLDGRNLYDRTEMTQAGLIYEGIGHANTMVARETKLACEYNASEASILTEDTTCVTYKAA